MATMALVITENGYGKLVSPDEFREQKRGGGGVTGYKVTEDSGEVCAVVRVETGAGERVLIYTAQGKAILTPVDDISERSRSAGGVKLINLADGDTVAGAAC
ncbi:MAG: DNA gyrase C-terminal beta-propeller domain-containing protein [Armatimonadota bacterium]